MKTGLTISLDAMGGDDAPDIVVKGAARFARKHKAVAFIFVGDKPRIQPLLEEERALKGRYTIIHTEDVVPGDMKPSIALRQGRNSSMRLAINAVAEGKADAVLSAGNTGALMAMAKFVLKTLPGITRPALASVMPTCIKGRGTVMLDLGANIECSARHLIEFSILGTIYAKNIWGIDSPRLGLLNVGSEEMKGHDFIREASHILSERFEIADYQGFVEGTDISSGEVDVIVADGFSGNVALKTVEGTAKMISTMVRQSVSSTPISYLGYPFMMPAFRKLKSRADPRLYNGGMFMGLRGLCVKSHGGADDIGFANALKVAHDLAAAGFNDRVAEAIEKIGLEDLFGEAIEV